MTKTNPNKTKEESKIKTYDDIREEAKRKVESERRQKSKVEHTKVPAKTSSRSTVKPTKSIKSKMSSEEVPVRVVIPEEPIEDSQMESEIAEYNPEPPQVQTIGPLFSKKQQNSLDKIIDQKLTEHEIHFSEYFSNLQLEMMRQFMIQKDELVAAMKSKIKSDLDDYLG